MVVYTEYTKEPTEKLELDSLQGYEIKHVYMKLTAFLYPSTNYLK